MSTRESYGRTDTAGRRLYYLNELQDFKVHHDDPDVRGWELYAGHQKIGRVEDLVADTTQNRVRYLDIEVQDRLYDGPYHSAYDQDYNRYRDHHNQQSSLFGSRKDRVEEDVHGADYHDTGTQHETEMQSDMGTTHYDQQGDLHMLVPIGLVRIDEVNKHLYLEGQGWENLRYTPRHRRGEIITPLYEVDVYNGIYTGSTGDYQRFERSKFRSRFSMDDDFYRTPLFGQPLYGGDTSTLNRGSRR